ncbi:hypothetical protein NPIL_357871 [Nephila pilipes]|uniref:Uncharacterized protein n=1 Tax=Nephila pilipes TaxID=299642 RepID=A0A8X6NS30_NEPPI|nr:hypothetical protein NPIL_357871 [Nephila pilipes]
MSYTLLLLVFGISVIYIETTVLGLGVEEQPKRGINVCGVLEICAEDQCCVGNMVQGYCVNNPAEGEPCANRTIGKEEYYCGRCGKHMICIEEICQKKNETL